MSGSATSGRSFITTGRPSWGEEMEGGLPALFARASRTSESARRTRAVEGKQPTLRVRGCEREKVEKLGGRPVCLIRGWQIGTPARVVLTPYRSRSGECLGGHPLQPGRMDRYGGRSETNGLAACSARASRTAESARSTAAIGAYPSHLLRRKSGKEECSPNARSRRPPGHPPWDRVEERESACSTAAILTTWREPYRPSCPPEAID